MNWLGEEVQKRIKITDTILDIGCGIMQATNDLKCKSILGVDIWKPYLEHIKNMWPTIQMDVTKSLGMFLDNSFDIVICTDLIEHLESKDVSYVLENIIRICRKKAIIFTPSGFDTNERSVDNSWGLGRCEYQRHLCLVTKTDLLQHGFTQFIPNQDNGLLGIYEKPY